MKFSVCILNKGNDERLNKNLESVKDIADEIIILSFKSFELTEKINKVENIKFFIKDFKKDFKENFSNAKNSLVEKANGDWILFLDSDEYLEKTNKNELKNFIKENEKKESFYMRIIGMLEGKRRSAHNEIRLFKNNKNIFFKGKIGESLESSFLKEEIKEKVDYLPLEIYNSKNDEEVSFIKEKVNFNIRLFEEVDEKERDSNYYFKLGNEYGRKNDFKKALEMYNISFMEDEINPSIYDEPRLILNKVKALHKLKMYKEELMFIKKWERKYNNFKDLIFMKLLIYRDKGDFKKAFDLLLDYLNEEEDIKYPSSEFNKFIDMETFKKDLFYLSQILD